MVSAGLGFSPRTHASGTHTPGSALAGIASRPCTSCPPSALAAAVQGQTRRSVLR